MADEESEAPSGGNKKLIIIGVVAAVVLIGGAVGITLALSGGDAAPTEAGAEVAAQVARAMRLAFGRSPTAAESKAACQLVEAHGLFGLCRALLNANEFVYVD